MTEIPLPAETETPWPDCISRCGHSLDDLVNAALLSSLAAVPVHIEGDVSTEVAVRSAALGRFMAALHFPDGYLADTRITSGLAEPRDALAARARQGMAGDVTGLFFRHPTLAAAGCTAELLADLAKTSPKTEHMLAAWNAGNLLNAVACVSRLDPENVHAAERIIDEKMVRDHPDLAAEYGLLPNRRFVRRCGYVGFCAGASPFVAYWATGGSIAGAVIAGALSAVGAWFATRPGRVS